MHKSILIKLTEVKEEVSEDTPEIRKFVLGELFVNPATVTILRSAHGFKHKIISYEGWPAGLDERVEFTEIHLNGPATNSSAIYAIGNIEITAQKLGGYYG